MLQTERLVLRRFVPEDWQGLYAYLSDAEVVRYEPYPALTAEQCQQIAERHATSEHFWAVCLREDGGLIGNLYLEKKEQETWELGYVFNRAYWKSGYATEAARALLHHVFTDCGAHRVMAECNPENVASWKLLERLGMRREGHLVQNVYFNKDANGNPLWQDTYMYGLLHGEWV